MKLTLNGFRCFENEVDMTIGDGITAVVGQNGGGKTTVLMGLASVGTKNRAPLTGKVQADAEMLVHRHPLFDANGEQVGWAGPKRARVSLQDGTFRRTMEWIASAKTSEVVEGDQGPTLSPIALAITPFSELSLEQRYDLMARVLKASPTMDELEAALPEPTEATQEGLKQIRKLASAGSWENAAAIADGAVTEAQANWRAAVGKAYATRYSVKSAEAFSPAGLPEVAKRTPTRIKGLLEAAAAAELKIKRMGRPVQEAQLAPLRLEAERLDVVKAELTKANKAMDAADKARQEALAVFNAAVVPGAPKQPCTCPGCGIALEVVGGEVRLADDAVDPAKLATLQAVYDKAKARDSETAAAYTEARSVQTSAQAAVARAESAARQLTQLTNRPEQEEVEGDPIGEQAKVDTWKAEAAAIEQWLKATAEHQAAVAWAKVAEVLAPDGLRATVLKKKLGEFNTKLATIASGVPGFLIRIEHDMQLTANFGPYVSRCGGEQFFADVAMQVTLAELEDWPVILIDRCETLDRDRRDLLFQYVLIPASEDRRVVVAFSMSSPAAAPDLADMGLGQSYWLDSTSIRPLSEVMSERKLEAA